MILVIRFSYEQPQSIGVMYRFPPLAFEVNGIERPAAERAVGPGIRIIEIRGRWPTGGLLDFATRASPQPQ